MHKIHKRLLSCLLIVALLLSVPLNSVPVTAAEDSRYGAGILSQMDNADALLYVYDRIVTGVANTEAKIDLKHPTHKVTGEQLGVVFEMVFRDYPEYFWLSGAWGGSTMGGYAISISPGYHMTGATLIEAQAALEQQVTALTADLEGKSDYEKSLLLHNRVAEATVYTNQGYHQTAYGALVQGVAVCAGYARAYQLLLQRVGIPAWYVTGASINPGTGLPENHGWNLVQLDGEWYYTDVTWDDQTNYTFYAYLNVNTRQITEDHIIGDYAAYLPNTNATRHNYHVRNDLVMREADDDDIADVIRNHYPARVYVTGDVAEFIQEFRDEIRDIAEELNVPRGFGYSYGYSILGREVILRFAVDHPCNYETVTVPATCLQDGYSANVCTYDFCHNRQDETVIPAAGKHTYDSACDATCNLCDASRETDGHIYDNACDAACNICGETRKVAGHQYDDDKDVTCNVCGFVRELSPEIPRTPGDATGDGRVNIRDLTMIQQFINRWDVPINEEAADVTGDGRVNIRDLTRIQQYLNKWDVELV